MRALTSSEEGGNEQMQDPMKMVNVLPLVSAI
jgi:hypothetical protein